jgi:mRNA interferase RelE/StbE
VKFRARYTPEAAARIRNLHPDIKRRVRDAIESLVESPLQGHSLKDELSGLRSYRIGKHRIIYRIHDQERVLECLLVGARKDIYEELRERMLRPASSGR